MTKLTKTIVFLTWVTTVDYFVFCFILMDMNAYNWHPSARVVLVFVWAATMAFGGIFCSGLEDDEE